MASIVTNSFRILQAKQFRLAFNPTATSSVFIGISKPTAWSNELLPDAPVDSSSYNVSDIREWLGAKRLTSSDVSLAIPRYNWTSGTVYPEYDDADTQLFEKQFFVMTDEYKIYKCIAKPTSTTQSTQKPTDTPTTGFVTTGDGYVWKYMMTLAAADAARFLTNTWIPVRELDTNDSSGSNQWLVQSGATAGTIDRGVVIAGGSGYSTATVQIQGDGSGAVATATIVGGAITSINVTNKGTNYTWAKFNIIGNGTGASARPVLSPIKGHGSSIVNELGAFFILINAVLNYDESNKFPKFNDYRKIFLIQNPCLYGTSAIAVDPVYSCVTKLSFSASAGGFIADEIVTGSSSGATARVVEYDSATKTLSLVLVTGTFQVAENVTGATSSATGNTITLVTNPELDPTKGYVIYKDYRRYIDRQSGQAESLTIAIGF